MQYLKTFFSLVTLFTLFYQQAQAAQHGNESGESVQRNLYEYNLYDRNFDRLRGRGIYDEEEEAYPNLYRYVERGDDRQATDRRSSYR